MDKNNNTTSWVLGVLAILLFVFGVYQYHRAETLKNTPPEKSEMPTANNNAQNSGQDYWNSVSNATLLNAIMKSIPSLEMEIPDVSAISLSFVSKNEFTGDSTPESIYAVPEWNGAYVESEIVFHRSADGTPEVVRTREQDGRISILQLGQGASVMNQLGYKIYSDEMAVVTFQIVKNDGVSVSSCDVRAYKWNSSTQLMEWSPSVAASHKADVCRGKPCRS